MTNNNNKFWIEKDGTGFHVIHFSDGTEIALETRDQMTAIVTEVLKMKGTIGY